MSLTLSNIKKSFGDKIIFNGFSYEFNDNGIYAVIGESGVGKTTLLRMIAGLDNRYKGKIEGGGFKNVSFAFQEYRLFPSVSALENVIVAIGNKKNNNSIIEAKQMLSYLGFSDEDMNLFPDELSGGMKQRAALLRTYLFSEKVALLDEPFSALDMLTKQTIHEWYLGVMEKIHLSTLFITHDIDEAILLSDRIYLLSGSPGEIVEEIIIKEPKPRREDFNLTPEFLAYKRQILSLL